MLLAPGVAVRVPLRQVVEALPGLATVIPAGRLSVKLRFVALTILLELSIVKVSVLVPPETIGSVPKALLNPGGRLTFNVSVAAALVPSEDDKVLEVLVCVPPVLLVTSTCTVQLAPAGTVPPV